jgi:hypothetical protein
MFFQMFLSQSDWSILHESIINEINVRLKYTLLTAYLADWWQKSKSVSLDHNGDRPILSEDKFIFPRTWNIWKITCYSCTYLIIISSEIIFIVFSEIFFQVIFEKWDRSYAFKVTLYSLFKFRKCIASFY